MTLENSDSDRRALYRLEGRFEGLSEQMTRMETANSREHSAVMERLDGMAGDIRRALDLKADKTAVDEHTKLLSTLKSSDDRSNARDGLLKGAFGAALAIVVALLSRVHF